MDAQSTPPRRRAVSGAPVVFAVTGQSGDYSERQTWLVCWSDTEGEAQQIADAINVIAKSQWRAFYQLDSWDGDEASWPAIDAQYEAWHEETRLLLSQWGEHVRVSDEPEYGVTRIRRGQFGVPASEERAGAATR